MNYKPKAMKKIFLILLFLVPIITYAQELNCKKFTKNSAIDLLGDFILSGRTHSLELAEGEEVVVFKTVSRNLVYKFVVIADKHIPQPRFLIADWDNNIIFDNAKHNFQDTFVFPCDKTQRIKIWIKVPGKDANKRGCVSLVVGVKTQ